MYIFTLDDTLATYQPKISLMRGPGWYESFKKDPIPSTRLVWRNLEKIQYPTLVSCSMCVCVCVHASHGHHSHCTVIAVVRKWRDTFSQNQETPKTHYSHLRYTERQAQTLIKLSLIQTPCIPATMLRLILCLLSTSLWPASYIRLC